MRARFSGFLIVAALLFPAAAQAAERRPIVAVFDVQAKGIKRVKVPIRSLTEYLATTISEGGSYRVVPPGDIRRALMKKTKETYKECYDQKCQIELGRELYANKTLSTTVLKFGKICVVTCNMYDLKTQTTDVSAKAKGTCNEVGLMASIDKVTAEIRAWGSGGSAFKEEDLGEKPAGAWTPAGAGEVIVGFSSEPAGAVVLVDGNLVCQKTPCSKSVSKGAHTVAMQAPKYMKRQERKVLSKGDEIAWKLKPNFGWLTVRSEPPGLEVTVNGISAGQTPLDRQEWEPGVYKVLVKSPCYYNSGKKVKIARGADETVSVKPKERQGAVNVKAKDAKGNDIIADVYVDGKNLGQTPGVYKVSVCAKELEVKHAKLGIAKKALAIRERKVTAIEVKLQGTRAGEVKQPGSNLFWLRCPLGQGWNGSSCQGKMQAMPWAKAMKACPAGYRLPTRQEFMNLLGGCDEKVRGGNFGKCASCGKSARCSSMFGNDNGFYWSSSEREYLYSGAWYVCFDYGLVDLNDKSYYNYVRCVR